MSAINRNFRVYHKLEPPYSVMLENRGQDDTLMFESSAVTILSSAESEFMRKQYTKVLDAYGCLGVLSLSAGGEDNLLYLVLVTGCISVGKICDSEIFCITQSSFVSLQNQPNDEERIVGVRNLFNSRTFYFAWSSTGQPWDLTLCAQRRMQDHDTDNRFFWNRSLHVHFQRFGIDCMAWLFKAICGGVEIRTVYAGNRQAKACLISRLSCERAGTRFNVRGTNDDGHVANFCETEQVIFLDDQIASFLQTRGSVPLFWEQPGIQVGSHKIKMSRGYETSAPAFERHLTNIRRQYGEQVMVNLLGRKEGEHMLSQAYNNHHKASVYAHDIPLINFDYHTECRGGNLKNMEKLKMSLIKYLDSFGYFYGIGNDSKVSQIGTIRTNCIDCLDRTNSVQSMLGLTVISKQLESLGLASKTQMVSRFVDIYKQIWTSNGDHISRIYAGTGALGGGRSKASDAARSATRTIQNNFLDNTKQEAIDILVLGSTLRGELADKARALLTTRRLNVSPVVIRDVVNRYNEYTETYDLRIFVGTWNVNGGKHFRSIAFKHQSMHDWVLDAPKILQETHPDMINPDVNFERPIDIFAIGFEEMVDLNASNIMSASQTNSREWEKYIQNMISRDHKYILLTKVQLVGVLLYVFIRPSLAPDIREVAVDTVKTGLGGATGNKGGVGIRFLINSTSICFVCAHLSAGQSQVNDRNSDYAEITKKMAFPMGRVIPSHDYVFWCGDFNYRIDIPNEEVKDLVKAENWTALQTMDQLNIQRAENKVFQGFKEGLTNFAPTYKYDQFCDDYDTSDKARTPAWTDRILWKHNPVLKFQTAENEQDLEKSPKLLLYARSELKTSDHRPVFGIYDVEIMKVNDRKRDEVFEDVLSQYGPQDGTVIITTPDGEFGDSLVDEIVGTFSNAGEIILVRFVGETMWLIYKNGQMALEALNYNKTEIEGTDVTVTLKTENWKQQVRAEISQWSSQNEPLFSNITNSLLGESFDIPSMDNYDSEGDDEGMDELHEPLRPDKSGSNTPRSGSQSPAEAMLSSGPAEEPLQPTRPQPPSRPRPPAPVRESTPPLPQPRNLADTVIVPEKADVIRGVPAERPKPPQRPGPPTKPPPPQRPGGPPPVKPAPPGSQQAPGSPSRSRPAQPPGIKQPLGPQAIGKIKSKRITRIGLPTNVSHCGHAKSPEEAAELIVKLMAGGTDIKGTLPAPLKPAGGLKPTTPILHRSKTASDIGTAESGDLKAPKEMSRFHSAENLSGTSEPSIPVPAPRQDSLNSENGDSLPKPKPAPRRNVQSVIIEPESTIRPPPVVPRPLSAIERGSLPPVPSRPETSQNYYSSIVDPDSLKHSEQAKILLGEKVTQDHEPSQSDPNTYETIWGNSAPVVPKRKDLEPSNASLMDKPLSPTLAPLHDPFDVSNTTNNVITPQPAASTKSQQLPTVPPRPADTFMPSTAQGTSVTNDISVDQNPDPWGPASSDPQLSECPRSPPPPPPQREDSTDLEEPSLTPTAQAPFCPPVPARPQGTVDHNVGLPPVPARPAPPPPVPRRPVV